MYWANVDENSIGISGKSILVVGNANANKIIFSFSGEWDGLKKIAVFKNSINIISVEVPDNLTLCIPWECCEEIGDTVYLGVYGIDEDNNIRRPTVWTAIDKIVDGVDMDGAGHTEPTKTIFVELLEKVEELDRGVMDTNIDISGISSAVENLEKGSTDSYEKLGILEAEVEKYSYHPNLKGREEPNQHPISSIEDFKDYDGGDMTPEGLLELLGGGST